MAFNVLEAKREGYTDAEIADYLATKSGFNISDARQEGYKDNEIISFLNKQNFSFGEAFMAGARAEAFSELTGAKQILGGELSDEQIAQENLARQASEERGFATGLGTFVGGLLNPSTLLPGSMLLKGAKGVAAAGAVGGAISGAVRPIYTEEDMGRLSGAAVGGALGGGLGFGLGKLIEKFGAKKADEIINTGRVSDDGTEIVTDTATLRLDENTGDWTVTDNSAQLADIRRRMQTGEMVTPAEQYLLREAQDSLAPLTPEEVRIFDIQQRVNEGGFTTPGELRILREYQAGQKAATQDIPATNVHATGDAESLSVRLSNELTAPVLPDDLAGAAPRYLQFVPDFESDLDKALYIVNGDSKSKAHEKYVQFIRQQLGLASDAEINKLSLAVKKELGQAVKEAQKLGQNTVSFKTSNAVDRLLNPVTKHLDNLSKEVYNLWDGKALNSAGYPSLSAKGVEKALNIMKAVDNKFSGAADDAYLNVVGYRKYLDDMKELKGKGFNAPTFENFIKKGIDADDQIRMAEAGFFDGCK